MQFIYKCFFFYLFLAKDDAVFRRKIAESANIDERNRVSENKRGRWDQPDAQINKSEDHWDRIVERARNQRGLVFFPKILIFYTISIIINH